MYIPMITEFFQMFMYDSETWESLQNQKMEDEIYDLTEIETKTETD